MNLNFVISMIYNTCIKYCLLDEHLLSRSTISILWDDLCFKQIVQPNGQHELPDSMWPPRTCPLLMDAVIGTGSNLIQKDSFSGKFWITDSRLFFPGEGSCGNRTWNSWATGYSVSPTGSCSSQFWLHIRLASGNLKKKALAPTSRNTDLDWGRPSPYFFKYGVDISLKLPRWFKCAASDKNHWTGKKVHSGKEQPGQATITRRDTQIHTGVK